ncbi:hyaluronan synthase [hydrocarbon metagenome]|uniref:Hyaluronan synthase n=1 Tax=hydrocarbon metagenome TaxID=938273 RepID=A0A0W8E7D1_9ZZZZ
MGCITSILITAFQRPHLLRWGLYSLAKQAMPADFETIVLNDGINDETQAICKEYQQELNLQYVFTGQRNQDGIIKWRVPGFAINIGAKIAQGKILIISCAEMFHINDCIIHLSYPLLANPKLIGIPIARDDHDSSFLNGLIASGGRFNYNRFYNYYPHLNTKLPFLSSISRQEFLSIGGYDEDFVGIGYDDNDLMLRLIKNGCTYFQTAAETIHLYHERIWYARENAPETVYNRNLFYSRQNQIMRNQNREWGKF